MSWPDVYKSPGTSYQFNDYIPPNSPYDRYNLGDHQWGDLLEEMKPPPKPKKTRKPAPKDGHLWEFRPNDDYMWRNVGECIGTLIKDYHNYLIFRDPATEIESTVKVNNEWRIARPSTDGGSNTEAGQKVTFMKNKKQHTRVVQLNKRGTKSVKYNGELIALSKLKLV